ncbi:DivIVA domain-containing protein [Luteococcus sp. Sow4_B9]|uniref:DivIVA domain-containing protein n=1 Tax=Luteococcus sp. Sow4_B9 TaxID=3438792 RepID=UPI003F99F171
MTWFLALVVVAILGAAFVVGSGRWGSMPELPDEQHSRLPGPGPISADDLREVRFDVVPRGYSMRDVDLLLARLIEQLDEAPAAPRRRTLDDESNLP